MRWPITRPDLPRTSSGTSGFFFCGIMLEPVQKASASSMKPNCCELHSTISSAMREKCTIISEAQAVNSIAKSRSATASSEFSQMREKPSSSAVSARSIGKVVPASAPAPSGSESVRLRQSTRRSRSRSSISNHASR